MKRIGNLFNKIVTGENIVKSYKNAIKGKHKQKSVKEFNSRLGCNLINLLSELANGTYETSKYKTFKLYEPKERVISMLPFRDMVVHHMLIGKLERFFVNSYISTTYSCIKGRGIHRCLRDVNKIVRRSEGSYCLKLDIRKFYQSIDKDRLKCKLIRKFKDVRLLDLMFGIIDSHVLGLPLGNYTSQYFANFYLNQFDYWIKTKVKHYFRYADDMVILHDDKKYLHELLIEIKHKLTEDDLSLSKDRIFPVSTGLDFVGYKMYPTHTLLRRSIKQRFVKKVRVGCNKKTLYSYYGWIKHCNGANLWGKYSKITETRTK